MSGYTHDGQQRILRLVQLLAGHEMTGMTPGEIAKQQACASSMVTRDLDNLKTAGFAEQVPETQRWRLAPEVVQISTKHQAAMERAARRLAETQQRYSRGEA